MKMTVKYPGLPTRYPRRFACRQVAIVAVIFSVGWILAQTDRSESALVHWHFDGDPGAPFTEEVSDKATLTGEIAPLGGTERRPGYGDPAPDGGKGCLALRNAETTEANGGFAWSEIADRVVGSSELSVEAWIKPDELRQAVILRLMSPDQKSGVILETRSDGSVGFLILENKEVNNAVVSREGQIISGEWQHVAGVFRNGSIFLYLNGNLVASHHSSTMPEIPDQLLFVGVGAYVRKAGGGGNAGQFFDGCIDEIRISDKAVDPGDFLMKR